MAQKNETYTTLYHQSHSVDFPEIVITNKVSH